MEAVSWLEAKWFIVFAYEILSIKCHLSFVSNTTNDFIVGLINDEEQKILTKRKHWSFAGRISKLWTWVILLQKKKFKYKLKCTNNKSKRLRFCYYLITLHKSQYTKISDRPGVKVGGQSPWPKTDELVLLLKTRIGCFSITAATVLSYLSLSTIWSF